MFPLRVATLVTNLLFVHTMQFILFLNSLLRHTNKGLVKI